MSERSTSELRPAPCLHMSMYTCICMYLHVYQFACVSLYRYMYGCVYLYMSLSDRFFMVDPLSYFSFQPVLHDWLNRGRGMCYTVCGMMHIKKTLLLIGKSSPCGRSGFPLSQSEWFFTTCPTPYNRK